VSCFILVLLVVRFSCVLSRPVPPRVPSTKKTKNPQKPGLKIKNQRWKVKSAGFPWGQNPAPTRRWPRRSGAGSGPSTIQPARQPGKRGGSCRMDATPVSAVQIVCCPVESRRPPSLRSNRQTDSVISSISYCGTFRTSGRQDVAARAFASLHPCDRVTVNPISRRLYGQRYRSRAEPRDHGLGFSRMGVALASCRKIVWCLLRAVRPFQ